MGEVGLVRPVAVILVTKDGTRVEPTSSLFTVGEHLIDAIGKAIETRSGRREESK